MRLVRTTDLETIVRLNDRLFPDQAEESLGEDLQVCTWWLLRREGEIAGFCGVRPVLSVPGSWYLARAGVLPGFRGHGAQTRMIRTRERYARTHNGDSMITYTVPHNWPSSNSLIRCGYKLYRPQTRWAGDVNYWIKDLTRRTRRMKKPLRTIGLRR